MHSKSAMQQGITDHAAMSGSCATCFRKGLWMENECGLITSAAFAALMTSARRWLPATSGPPAFAAWIIFFASAPHTLARFWSCAFCGMQGRNITIENVTACLQ